MSIINTLALKSLLLSLVLLQAQTIFCPPKRKALVLQADEELPEKIVSFVAGTKPGDYTEPTKFGTAIIKTSDIASNASCNESNNTFESDNSSYSIIAADQEDNYQEDGQSPQELLIQYLCEKNIDELNLLKRFFTSKNWRYRYSFFYPERELNNKTPYEWITEHSFLEPCPWLEDLIKREDTVLKLYEQKLQSLKLYTQTKKRKNRKR